MRVVDVADFEAGALARETAGPEGREAALVRELGQRVRLVHELRELARAEELFDRRDDRTDVDQRLRRDRLDVLNGHALAHDALETQQADAELVLQQFADRTHAAIAEMVDVVLVRLTPVATLIRRRMTAIMSARVRQRVSIGGSPGRRIR